MEFNWGGLMHAGLHSLGLMPDQFWSLTPAELLVKLGQTGGTAPLSRARLEELSRAFPDIAKEG